MALFTGIIGPPGSGKSCFGVAILSDAFRLGFPIACNITSLKLPHLSFARDVIPSMESIPQFAYVLVDELGEICDAYDFASKEAREMNTFVRQGRKGDLSIYYSVQDEILIPRRLRRATTRYYLMEDLDARKPNHTYETCDALFKVTVMEKFTVGATSFVFNGKPFQSLYDSRERIKGKSRSVGEGIQIGTNAPVL